MRVVRRATARRGGARRGAHVASASRGDGAAPTPLREIAVLCRRCAKPRARMRAFVTTPVRGRARARALILRATANRRSHGREALIRAGVRARPGRAHSSTSRPCACPSRTCPRSRGGRRRAAKCINVPPRGRRQGAARRPPQARRRAGRSAPPPRRPREAAARAARRAAARRLGRGARRPAACTAWIRRPHRRIFAAAAAAARDGRAAGATSPPSPPPRPPPRRRHRRAAVAAAFVRASRHERSGRTASARGRPAVPVPARGGGLATATLANGGGGFATAGAALRAAEESGGVTRDDEDGTGAPAPRKALAAAATSSRELTAKEKEHAEAARALAALAELASDHDAMLAAGGDVGGGDRDTATTSGLAERAARFLDDVGLASAGPADLEEDGDGASRGGRVTLCTIHKPRPGGTSCSSSARTTAASPARARGEHDEASGRLPRARRPRACARGRAHRDEERRLFHVAMQARRALVLTNAVAGAARRDNAADEQRPARSLSCCRGAPWCARSAAALSAAAPRAPPPMSAPPLRLRRRSHRRARS